MSPPLIVLVVVLLLNVVPALLHSPGWTFLISGSAIPAMPDGHSRLLAPSAQPPVDPSLGKCRASSCESTG